ncbi:hypothetical protein KDL45_07560, partial [bacterium]|nr:hypothetical protein [bacterium]
MRAKSYAKIAIWTITALVTAFAAATHIACGTQGDIIGGTTAWPVSGTKPWAKLDLGDGVLALLAPEGEVYLEPCLIKALGHHWIYFERRVVEAREDGLDYATHSEILVAKGRNAFDYEIEYDGLPVLYPTQDWEGEFVGAPTILQREDNSLVMWY